MPLPRAIHRTQAWYRRLTVPQFTVVTGLLVISLGTLLLASPLCSSQNVGLWEALFTATSAVTVTGLTVIDVGRDLTTVGQAVLAIMILVGGLGLMAITTFLQGFVVRGASLRRRLDRGQTLDEFGVGGVGGTFKSIAVTGSGADHGWSFCALQIRFQTFLQVENDFGPRCFTASRPTTTQGSASGTTASRATGRIGS